VVLGRFNIYLFYLLMLFVLLFIILYSRNNNIRRRPLNVTDDVILVINSDF